MQQHSTHSSGSFTNSTTITTNTATSTTSTTTTTSTTASTVNSSSNNNVITATNNNNNNKNNNKNNTETDTTATATTSGTSAATNSSFVIKCLLKTVRFMWQVTEIPSRLGETLTTIYKYAQESVDVFLCVAGKARRKERDGDQNSTDTKLYLEESVLERKLPEADLKALVDLPAGLDYNEWLASHTLALFEHVNLVYGTISEFCTPTGCPDMTGPGNRTYLWFDEKGKKTRVAAPQYIDYVMTFTQKTVSDESIFPTKYANEFPGSFESIARKILRLQFHVIAHLYAAHFREIALLGLHTHLNLTFAHLTALHRRFTLIDEKETDVLRDLEVALRLTDDTQPPTGGNQPPQQQPHHHHQPQQQPQQLQLASQSSDQQQTAAAAATSATQQQQHQLQHHPQQAGKPDEATAGQLQQPSSAGGLGPPLIDGDPVVAPICTQPEATGGVKGAGGSPAPPAFVGGASSNLIGGILGDLTTGEFGDTTRYCTSALPSSAAAAGAAGPAGGEQANCNNGAGAMHHLNFTSINSSSSNATTTNSSTSNNNNNNNNNSGEPSHQNTISATTPNHHHAHPHHHHHHHHHHNNHYMGPHPNSGLIQCNATVAPSLTVVATSAASSAAGAAATAASSTSSA